MHQKPAFTADCSGSVLQVRHSSPIILFGRLGRNCRFPAFFFLQELSGLSRNHTPLVTPLALSIECPEEIRISPYLPAPRPCNTIHPHFVYARHPPRNPENSMERPCRSEETDRRCTDGLPGWMRDRRTRLNHHTRFRFSPVFSNISAKFRDRRCKTLVCRISGSSALRRLVRFVR